MKVRLTVLLTVLCTCFFGQEKIPSTNYSYYDADGNRIVLQKQVFFPEKIDSTFFEQGISGSNLNEKLVKSGRKYEFIVKQVITVKKDKKYQVSVSAHPLEAKPEEIKSNLGEWVYFIITKKAGKDKLKVEQVILDHFGL